MNVRSAVNCLNEGDKRKSVICDLFFPFFDALSGKSCRYQIAHSRISFSTIQPQTIKKEEPKNEMR